MRLNLRHDRLSDESLAQRKTIQVADLVSDRVTVLRNARYSHLQSSSLSHRDFDTMCRKLAIAQAAVQSALATALDGAAAAHRQRLSEELQQLEEAAAASREARLVGLRDANEEIAADSLREAAQRLAATKERAVAKEKVGASGVTSSRMKLQRSRRHHHGFLLPPPHDLPVACSKSKTSECRSHWLSCKQLHAPSVSWRLSVSSHKQMNC